ncbi:hypothetical protein EB118_03600 [bacterium]|nr:hypothetical protein [bacterium]NDC94065.1 hypothetical protein [bacterium]NDD82751.1 hypothetical protein [bacterium]NDG29171.1 hypothetical protein [bacterium]
MKHVAALVLLAIGVTSIVMGILDKKPLKEQPSVEIKKEFETKAIPLDYQFSDKNLPSNVYTGMFNGGNVWMGGYNLDTGRTLTTPRRV